MDFSKFTERDLVQRWDSLHGQLLTVGLEILEKGQGHPSYETLRDLYENCEAINEKVTAEMERREMFVERQVLKEEYAVFLKN